MSDEPQDLYVSAVTGHVVSRPGSTVLIGASRDMREPSKLTWDTEQVVRVPAEEYLTFRREYDRAIRDKSLRIRTKADFDASRKREEDLAKKDAEPRAKADADAAKSGKKKEQ